jgi:hypothetical protein
MVGYISEVLTAAHQVGPVTLPPYVELSIVNPSPQFDLLILDAGTDPLRTWRLSQVFHIAAAPDLAAYLVHDGTMPAFTPGAHDVSVSPLLLLGPGGAARALVLMNSSRVYTPNEFVGDPAALPGVLDTVILATPGVDSTPTAAGPTLQIGGDGAAWRVRSGDADDDGYTNDFVVGHLLADSLELDAGGALTPGRFNPLFDLTPPPLDVPPVSSVPEPGSAAVLAVLATVAVRRSRAARR